MTSVHPALTAARVEFLMRGVHPSVPPELVRDYLARGYDPLVAPRNLHARLSRALLVVSGAHAQVASDAVETVRQYRESKGWRPESYWTRDNRIAYVERVVAELAPDAT